MNFRQEVESAKLRMLNKQEFVQFFVNLLFLQHCREGTFNFLVAIFELIFPCDFGIYVLVKQMVLTFTEVVLSIPYHDSTSFIRGLYDDTFLRLKRF